MTSITFAPAPAQWEEHPAEKRSCTRSLLRYISKKIDCFVENRGGLALFMGSFIVPSQNLEPKSPRSQQILAAAESSQNFRLERFSLPVQDTRTNILGIICYPKDWDPLETRCILYNNPNAKTLASYFTSSSLINTPGELMEIGKRPLVMYDYRGTGLSSGNNSCCCIRFRPTCESILVDGETVLRYALTQFSDVCVMGNSLGGGVATIALERHLCQNPDDTSRVSLMSLDSFSTTPKMIIPSMPNFANWAGWFLGAMMDAETSIKRLIKRDISIMILCHTKDPVIPEGGRMADYVETLQKTDKVFLIYSPNIVHARLSPDMISQIKYKIQ